MSTTRRRRPALILLVCLGAAGCLALAWWQWTRYESTSGSFQNLGYALQWPFFAFFVVYGWWRVLRLELAKSGGRPTEAPAPAEPARRGPVVPRYRPPVIDDEDDEELAAYNRRLAQLNEQDQQNPR
jgi:DNA-binding transcriptional regulator of glucitol operon